MSRESPPTGREPTASASPTITDALLEQAEAELRRGRHQAAAKAARQHLDGEPDHPRGWYLLAVAERYLGQPARALRGIEKLMTLQPDYGRAFQEAGHNYRDLQQPAQARAAYERAVSLNPALLASWQALLEIYRAGNESERATQVAEQVQRLESLPRELLSVSSMVHEGRLFKAEQLCRAFLQMHPHHVEAMRLLADLGLRLQVLDDAEFLLESALEFEPDNLRVRFDYVNALHRRQKFAQALEQARTLRERAPGRPAFELAFANQNLAVGRYDDALEIYERVIGDNPGHAGAKLVRGHALKTLGRFDDAVTAYHDAIESRATFGDAWWSLANLKTYRFADDEIDRMRRLEADPVIAAVDRYHLCFALGKALEDREAYDESFAYYESGNLLKKRECRYDPERIEREFRAQKDVCTPELMAAKANQGNPAPDPIFIVGLPRAGSTLLEQILASHSQVDGTMELPNILALAHRLNGRRMVGDDPVYPGVLHELDADRLGALGRRFIEDTRIYRHGAPRFIDKMPNNFRHIGLIHLILPNARIIDARRHPMACCFSGFKQLFAEGQEFTYGLEEIGRYYRGYVDLMDHWDTVLPGRVLRVRYEDVVADLESEVRRILEFLELPFEPACLDFHRTDRAVRTPSSEQVRQPIYSRGLEQWRAFESHLQPLRDALGPLAEGA